MKRERSWTRTQYEYCYSTMRRQTGSDEQLWLSGIDNEIIRAADYSYQAWGYEPHGWINDRRRKRFYQIKWQIFCREDLPF